MMETEARDKRNSNNCNDNDENRPPKAPLLQQKQHQHATTTNSAQHQGGATDLEKYTKRRKTLEDGDSRLASN
jgi:hypothetical protein